MDIKWSQQDQEWLLTSSLSSKGVDAYKACVETQNPSLILHLSDTAGDSDEFIVDYVWKPSYAAPNPADFHIVALNASLSGDPKNVKTPSSDSFAVKRISMFKPLVLSVHVDGQGYPSITLPAFPAKKLEKQVRETTFHDGVWGGGNSHVHNVCVTLDNNEQDAIIVPNSINVRIDQTYAERGSMNVGGRTYNDRQACVLVAWSLGAADGHVEGTATVSAMVLKAVPITDIHADQITGVTPMFKTKKVK